MSEQLLSPYILAKYIKKINIYIKLIYGTLHGNFLQTFRVGFLKLAMRQCADYLHRCIMLEELGRQLPNQSQPRSGYRLILILNAKLT